MSIVIGILTVALVLVCAVAVLIILVQRPSANAGMGASMGGSAAESVFGGQASDVLARSTIVCTTIFFVLSFILYLSHMSHAGKRPSGIGEKVKQMEAAAAQPAKQEPPTMSPAPAAKDTAAPAAEQPKAAQ